MGIEKYEHLQPHEMLDKLRDDKIAAMRAVMANPDDKELQDNVAKAMADYDLLLHTLVAKLAARSLMVVPAIDKAKAN